MAKAKYDNSWFKDLVVYQIWCRSFKDSNGDGIGDLNGVLEELDYIKSLGVNCIWFSPIYPSPNADYGYDISDYRNIHKDFGDLTTFKKLLDEAHKRDMKVVMDLVVNHSSDEHEWFKEGAKSKDNPYHDYYFWRDGRGGNSKNGTNPPNNWVSMFEGGAWEYNKDLDQYYLHVFSKKQPDLNMDNPKVREEVKDIMRFWLDMGVDGFREDVITFISKKEGLPDGFPLPIACGIEHYNKGPHIHEYVDEFRNDVINQYDCFVVAESPMTNAKSALDFTAGEDRAFDIMISFDHMTADCIATDTIHIPFSLRRMKKAFSSWQYKMARGGAWNALYIENHDHPRIISRYGSEKYWKESGKMLATMCYMQSGTAFVYQGQELGMMNIKLKRLEDFKDVVTFNNAKLFKKFGLGWLTLKITNKTTRENARTPVQWSREKNAGFTTGTPWFFVNQNYKKGVNRDDEEKDPDSILNYYRKLFQIRQADKELFVHGAYKEFYPRDRKVYCYERTCNGRRALVVCSFSKHKIKFKAPKGYQLTDGKLILQNYDKAPASARSCKLRPYECRVYLYES